MNTNKMLKQTKLANPRAQIKAAAEFCMWVTSYVEDTWPEMLECGYVDAEDKPEVCGLCVADVLDALACLSLRFEVSGVSKSDGLSYFMLRRGHEPVDDMLYSLAQRVAAHLRDDECFGRTKMDLVFEMVTNFGCGPAGLIVVPDKDGVCAEAYQSMFDSDPRAA
jgi:hypothetical protein